MRVKTIVFLKTLFNILLFSRYVFRLLVIPGKISCITHIHYQYRGSNIEHLIFLNGLTVKTCKILYFYIDANVVSNLNQSGFENNLVLNSK